MIAAWQSWPGDRQPPTHSIIEALTAYRGSAQHFIEDKCHFFGHKYDASGKRSVAFHGWLDNAADLAQRLHLRTSDPAALYSAALMKWGEAADEKLVGNYAAIAAMPDGRLRLARSPWDAPPLYYANDAERAIVSPLLRALFAGGTEKRLDYNYIVDQLAYDFRDGDDQCWYHGIRKVPMGAIVMLKPGNAAISRWYSVQSITIGGSIGDEECAETALDLLRDAAANALVYSQTPALALSGGLDSSLTASCLIEELNPQRSLKTITFGPDPEWPGLIGPGVMGDEVPLVREFAAMHPQIEMHIADPALAGFDYRSREMMAAMQIFVPGLANIGMFHGVYAKAQELDCDTLLSAELANQSFSNDGRWAYTEYARSGRWIELARLLNNRPGDPRPFWRKAIALSVLPHLPGSVRSLLRSLVHPERRDMVGLLTPLSQLAISVQSQKARKRGSGSDWGDFTFPADRMAAAEADHYAADGVGGDVHLAFEQLYGIKRRDVTAYRPLIEFCIGLPTEQFASCGEERRLAKRMAKGRMPDGQRLNSRYGQHNADWHTRIGRERRQILRATQTMRDHTFLSQVLDIDRIQHLLRRWPTKPTLDIEEDWPRMLAIPRAVLAAQFIGMVEGRNDL